MIRFGLVSVDCIKFKLALAGEWTRALHMRQFFFSKNCANTEIHSFVESYATRILEEGNNHFLPALL